VAVDRQDIHWPLAGTDRRYGFQNSPGPYTTPDSLNVRNEDTFLHRLRGGSRPGLAQILPPRAATTPILVPATIEYSATKDARLYKLSPGSNYGTTTQIPVGTQIADATVAQRSVLHFDMSTLPAGATITAASLMLYSPTDYGVDPRPALVQRMTNTSWVETTITWTSDNASFTATDQATWNMFTAGGALGVVAVTIPILALARDAYAVQSKQLHVMLKAVDDSGAIVNAQVFYSREWGTSSQRPKLSVTYTVPA